ncbi:tRNA epoxyqueuosine(34) reductase QueG [Blastopirellula sp. JC732]|uniref:tRNA epoxyqueuosine(34) reductase QueG n=1 Tax=Blastopirellula sediminis TaxID=2894196 RepID=A0A9X1SJB9_9BACT|nr:tRNA epoxyqueuosine(34) reductase QueG [Blastopirellula sediminis]MCC9604499.1 tRNA epoxyqueuosine(34) reductase QueG [Blastopirellula sediminis]MCC9632202.1 tRNA epoxyqueuosine(34) reductase QueG [Blastopirellula sediminis]
MKEAARRLGFLHVGVCPAVTPTGIDAFRDWLAAGYAGEMQYLADRADAYADPSRVLEGARSIVMLTLPYRTETPRPTAAGQGRVSRYAWGEVDYHDLIHDKLKALKREFQQLTGDADARGVVDTAPLLERDFAQLAGLGWIGKNTLLLNKHAGSLFFLAALLTNVELEYDEPHNASHCGTCTACLDVCPTSAFPAPHVLDATRCISYLTIELRGPIPRDLREGMGEWVFGCDLCQDVCPWNRKAPHSEEKQFLPQRGNNPLDLIELFDLDDEAFKQRFRKSPIWRPRRRGLLRNAAIALGNRPTPEAVPALIKGLNDEEPLIRGAAAWALSKYGCAKSLMALQARILTEKDTDVQEEIHLALKH